MTEEEKKEFEEFLLWKKDRKKQETESSANASNTNSEEEKYQEIYDNNIHNGKKRTNWKIIIYLLFLLCLGLVIASKIKIQPESNTSPKELEVCSTGSTIKDTMRERIVREIKEEAKQQAKEKLTYIKFTSAYLGKPNSAGGCDAHFSFKNTSKNTIKYLYIKFVVYNAVDDIVLDELGRDGTELQYTGPLRPGRSDSGTWECIIYDYSAKRLVMTSLDIVYMDGMKIHYNSEEVKALIKEKK